MVTAQTPRHRAGSSKLARELVRSPTRWDHVYLREGSKKHRSIRWRTQECFVQAAGSPGAHRRHREALQHRGDPEPRGGPLPWSASGCASLGRTYYSGLAYATGLSPYPARLSPCHTGLSSYPIGLSALHRRVLWLMRTWLMRIRDIFYTPDSVKKTRFLADFCISKYQLNIFASHKLTRLPRHRAHLEGRRTSPRGGSAQRVLQFTTLYQ